MAALPTELRQSGPRRRGNDRLLRLMRFTGWFLEVCLEPSKKVMTELLDIGVLAEPAHAIAAEQTSAR